MTIQANFPAIKPSLMLDFANTKQLDSRITYTRASTASYYNGVTTAMAEQNLLTQSQTFDQSPWSVVNASRTANTTVAPDGTTTGDTLTASAVTGVPYITQSITVSAPFVYSVYVKAGTHSFVQLFDNHGVNAFATFNLSTGTVGNSGNGASASIVDAGGGWYRCVMSVPTASLTTTSIFIAPMPAGNSARFASGTYVGTETLILWGAQLEQRSAVTAYTATTTQAITNYIPKLQSAASGVARFDNNPTTGESLGLLIEESRTNLFTYSEQFDNAAWTKSQSTINANNIVAPDGTLTGDELVPNTTSAEHYCQQSYTKAASAITYSITVYAKASASGYKFLISTDDAVTGGCSSGVFNLSTGVFDTSSSGTIFTFVSRSGTSVGNGWYRINFVITTNTATAIRTNFFVYNASNVSTFAGNGFSGVFIWGAQLEAGAFATSYIPTVASQVTRAADAASMTGTNFSSWYNQAEGTIYSEAAVYAIGSRGIFDFTDGTTSNQMTAFAGTGSSGQRHLNVRVSGSVVVTLDGGSYADGAYSKQATVLKANDFALSLAGATAVTALSGSAPIVNQMLIGNSTTSASVLNGTLKKIAYYPIRLSNTNLVALTS